MRGSYYLFEDGRHVVELHLFITPEILSCRFALCHPDTIDSAFIGLLHRLVIATGMEVTIREDVRPEHEYPFPLAEFPALTACLPEYIAARRAEWVAAFGDERMAVSTNECYRRIILPLCQPHVVRS